MLLLDYTKDGWDSLDLLTFSLIAEMILVGVLYLTPAI